MCTFNAIFTMLITAADIISLVQLYYSNIWSTNINIDTFPADMHGKVVMQWLLILLAPAETYRGEMAHHTHTHRQLWCAISPLYVSAGASKINNHCITTLPCMSAGKVSILILVDQMLL